jgi:hypothetical protein
MKLTHAEDIIMYVEWVVSMGIIQTICDLSEQAQSLLFV